MTALKTEVIGESVSRQREILTGSEINTVKRKLIGKRGFRDLTGRRFGRLVAIEPTGEHASDGCYYWLCKCSCGNTKVVSSNKLLQGRTVSCGCYGKEQRYNSHTYVCGTCLEFIRKRKLSSNNTSGVRGVSASRGRWQAKISFAGKQFFLGRYDRFDAAAAVIREAEAIRLDIAENHGLSKEQAINVFAKRMEELKHKRLEPIRF